MANGIARARLRPGKDDDIQAALDDVTRTQDESDVVRAALRLYFGLEGQERAPRIRQPQTERPARPRPIQTVKPVLQAVKTGKMPQEANKALDTLLGF